MGDKTNIIYNVNMIDLNIKLNPLYKDNLF
jgi:hypothetical protein